MNTAQKKGSLYRFRPVGSAGDKDDDQSHYRTGEIIQLRPEQNNLRKWLGLGVFKVFRSGRPMIADLRCDCGASSDEPDALHRLDCRSCLPRPERWWVVVLDSLGRKFRLSDRFFVRFEPDQPDKAGSSS